MVVRVDQTGIAQQMRAVDLARGFLRQIFADGADAPVLAVDIHAVQERVVIVTGDESGEIADQQIGHLLTSLKVNRP